jgi:hypothetical protein
MIPLNHKFDGLRFTIASSIASKRKHLAAIALTDAAVDKRLTRASA